MNSPLGCFVSRGACRLERSALSGTALLAVHESLCRRIVLVGLALEVNFNTLGQKTLTSMLTAAGQNGSAVFSFHPRAESELLLPSALRGLVRAFHSSNQLSLT
jgi:hypothetical protein